MYRETGCGLLLETGCRDKWSKQMLASPLKTNLSFLPHASIPKDREFPLTFVNLIAARDCNLGPQRKGHLRVQVLSGNMTKRYEKLNHIWQICSCCAALLKPNFVEHIWKQHAAFWHLKHISSEESLWLFLARLDKTLSLLVSYSKSLFFLTLWLL